MQAWLYSKAEEAAGSLSVLADECTEWNAYATWADSQGGTAEWWKCIVDSLPRCKGFYVGTESGRSELELLDLLHKKGVLHIVPNSEPTGFGLAFEFRGEGGTIKFMTLPIFTEMTATCVSMLVEAPEGHTFAHQAQAFWLRLKKAARLWGPKEFSAYAASLNNPACLDVAQSLKSLTTNVSETNNKESNPVAGEVDLNDVQLANLMQFLRASLNQSAPMGNDALEMALARSGHLLTDEANVESLRIVLDVARQRKILVKSGDCWVLGHKKLEDYSRPDHVLALRVSMKHGEWYDRKELPRMVALYFGFQRVTKQVREQTKSAINSAIRTGILIKEGTGLLQLVSK